MMLIVVAMSRISMRIVNSAIDDAQAMAKRRRSVTAPGHPAATGPFSASPSAVPNVTIVNLPDFYR